MNKLIFAIALPLMAMVACKNDTSTQNTNPPDNSGANVSNLAGHWVAIDFCARANQYGSVVAAVNNTHLPFSYALTFANSKPDSVETFDGTRVYSLPVSYKADTIEVKGARGANKSVFLVFNSKGDRSLTMFDPSPAGTQTDKFIKSKANTKDGRMAFETALNHNLFGGNFIQIGAKSGGKPIMFTPGGYIMNFKDFDRFTVCTGGDCLVAGNEIDAVTFYKSDVQNSDKLFGFRYSNHNDTLSVVTLSPNPKDPKSVYQIGKPVYKFVRKTPE